MPENISRTHWFQYSLTTLVALIGAIGYTGLKSMFTKPDSPVGVPAGTPAPTATVAPAATFAPTVVSEPVRPVPTPFRDFETFAPPTPHATAPPRTVVYGEWSAPPPPVREVPPATFPKEPKGNPRYKTADKAMNEIHDKVKGVYARLDDRFHSGSFARNFLMEQRTWLWQRAAEWKAGGDEAAISSTIRRTEFLRTRYERMPR